LNHQSIHKELKKKIEKLRKKAKVSVGPYSNCRHKFSPGAIIIKNDTSSGFKIFGYDGSGVMTFYVYTNESQEIKKYITEKLN
jgi:hypothetical protein